MYGDEFSYKDKLERALGQFNDVHLVSVNKENPTLVRLGVSLLADERKNDPQRVLALKMRKETFSIDREHSVILCYPKGKLDIHVRPENLKLLAVELGKKVYDKPTGMRVRLNMALNDLSKGALPADLVDLTIVVNGRVDGFDRAESMTKKVNGPALSTPPYTFATASYTNVFKKVGASTLTVTARFLQ